MTGQSSAATLEISLLGGFHIRDRTGERIELPGRKDCALLGFLAVSPGETWSREKLAALLWGDSGDRQARDSLKQALLRLRRSFAPASLPLISTRQTVTLDRDVVTVDVAAFEQLLSVGTPESLQEALVLYRGDLLDGIHVRASPFEDWLRVERERLRERAVDASIRLMVQSLEAGRPDRTATAARRLLSLEPLHEGACRALMQVHAESGQRAQALKLFEALREKLHRELAVLPEPETVALYHSIRNGRDETSASTAEPAASQDAIERRSHALRPPARVAEAACEVRAKPSIAVLPFAIFGNDAEQEYFADGLTEDITTDLSRVSALSVAPSHTVLAFKGSTAGVEQAVRDLNVDYLLEGSVRRAAGRVRVTAQLVDCSTRSQVWGHRYDRSVDDIFAVQDEITESIIDVLKLKLLPEERVSIRSYPTTRVDAYQYHLMGRTFYLRGINKHSLRIAREMFAKAIEIDPQYARAYAATAICDSFLSMGDPNATYDSTRENSLRALELDPHMPEAHALKGLALYADGRYAEAGTEFERAIRLGPDLFETHFFYARNCRMQGLHREAAALFKRAAELRPNDFRSLGLVAKSYKALGQGEPMVAAARECLERVEAEIEAHPDNAGALAFGSAVLAELGQRTRAEDWATRAVMIGPDDRVVLYNVARTHAILGDCDAALSWLDRAFNSSAAWQRRLAPWMKSDEDIEPLRSHPRYEALLRRLEEGLALPADGAAQRGDRR